MKISIIVVASAALMLIGCVTQPSNIDGVRKGQERYIDDMQSHRTSPPIENNEDMDLDD